MRWVPLLIVLILVVLSGALIIPRTKNKHKRYFLIIVLFYVAFLGSILFTPISINGLEIHRMPLGTGRVNLTQLDLNDIGFVENIILTIPLGIIIKKLFVKIPIIGMVLLGLLFGTMFETIQFYLSQYLLMNRTSDINDVLSNATGIVIGGLLVVLYRQLQRNQQ